MFAGHEVQIMATPGVTQGQIHGLFVLVLLNFCHLLKYFN